jgi:hypothetical protein
MAAMGLAVLILAMSPPTSLCTPPARSGSGDALTMRLHLIVEVKSPDGLPSPGIIVRFIDTAPRPHERGLGLVLGSTDLKGVFESTVTHVWPDYFSPARRPDAGTFDIMVAEEQIFHAAVECLPLQGQERMLKLSVVATSNVIVITEALKRATTPPNKRMQLTKPAQATELRS